MMPMKVSALLGLGTVGKAWHWALGTVGKAGHWALGTVGEGGY